MEDLDALDKGKENPERAELLRGQEQLLEAECRRRISSQCSDGADFGDLHSRLLFARERRKADAAREVPVDVGAAPAPKRMRTNSRSRSPVRGVAVGHASVDRSGAGVGAASVGTSVSPG